MKVRRVAEMFQVHEDLDNLLVRLQEDYQFEKNDRISVAINSIISELSRLVRSAEVKQFDEFYRLHANKNTIPIEVIRDYLKNSRVQISEAVLRKRVTRKQKSGQFSNKSRRNP